MAGERIGKTYEALIKVVLDRLSQKGKLDGNIYWNETPTGISVEPDFIIGPDINHPKYVIMATHVIALHASEKKSWRNIGELCEIKTSLETIPYAVNIVFDALIKEDLKRMQAATFDSQLLVGDLQYGASIKKWVDNHQAELPTDQQEKAYAIAHNYPDETFQKLLNQLEKDVYDCLQTATSDTNDLWSYERERISLNISNSPKSKYTSVRKGISKLLIFDDVELGIDIYRNKKIDVSRVPTYLFTVGLVGHAIGRVIPVDEDIKNAFGLLTDEQIRLLYHSVDECTTLQNWLHNLRNVDNIEFMAGYVSKEYRELCNPHTMVDRVIRLHDDEYALVETYSTPTHWPPSDVWLVSYLMELIKASTKSGTGYGISQLAVDVVEAGFGSSADLSSAGQFGGGFGFSAWLMRKNSPFKPELVNGVGEVLSSKLAGLGQDKTTSIANSCLDTIIHSTIETKLCTYRNFAPLPELLVSAGVAESMDSMVKIRSCFAEKGNLGGSTGVTSVFHIKNTLINWQSATDAGKDHKRKELCGRATSIRYTWDEHSNKYIKRPNVHKLILFLDGTWRQKDIDALVRSGWDEIYYPDEIDKLKAAII